MEEQEIATEYLLNKRQRDEGKTPTINNKCRLCKTNIEDITHIISACPMMSSFFFFFFFYSLFKVDIQNYVIVISLVTIY